MTSAIALESRPRIQSGVKGQQPEEGIDDLARNELRRFEALRVYDPAALLHGHLAVLPTFRTPHVTIGFADLDHGLSVLASSVRERRLNPYHGT